MKVWEDKKAMIQSNTYSSRNDEVYAMFKVMPICVISKTL
jgi:hypothetical protein